MAFIPPRVRNGVESLLFFSAERRSSLPKSLHGISINQSINLQRRLRFRFLVHVIEPFT